MAIFFSPVPVAIKDFEDTLFGMLIFKYLSLIHRPFVVFHLTSAQRLKSKTEHELRINDSL